MRASLIAAFDRAAALKDWSALHARADATFFQSPAFVSAWLDAAGDRIRLLRVEQDGAPLALAFIGAAGREARFGETGREDFDRLYVEYQDFLLAPGAGDAARDAALDALIDGEPAAAEFVVRNARPALARAFARAAERKGLDLRILKTQPTFAVDLSQPQDAAISASLRAKIRRSLRRYEERGPVRLTAAATPADRAAAFAELTALHGSYWRGRGEPGAFAAPALRAFHERFIEQAPDAVDLLRVAAADRTIGVLYNFIGGRRAYNYQSGFQPEEDNQFAPGFTAHWLAIAHYRDRGLSAYDLMAGEADYKRRLAREGETLSSLVIERRNVLQRAKSLARRFRPAGTRRT
jgi:CelD/BcsL family acetyltransferase involved in cellulose biosynthesis